MQSAVALQLKYASWYHPRSTATLWAPFENFKDRTSGQDGGIGRYTLLPHTTKRRTTTNVKNKNKKQPELPENWTVWKSDNRGVKEEMFIQSRRGGEGQQGWRGCVARWQTRRARQTLADQSHICMWISQEQQMGSKVDYATQGCCTEY